MTLTIELAGVRVFGRHGVEERERTRGQMFLYDVELDVPDDALSDRIEDAVDYRNVARCVREVSDGRRFQLLEALADAIAVELIERFPAERARVRVRKPEVQLDPPVAYTAVTAERRASRR